MKPKRMAMGAAVIGCVTAAMVSGAWAQEATTHKQLNARSGGTQQFNARAGQVNARQAGSAHMNQGFDARAHGNYMAAAEQSGARRTESRLRTEGRMGTAEMREGRGFATEHERFGRVATESRYGRGPRGALVGGEDGYGGAWRGDRLAYRGVGVGVAGGDYRYRDRRLYAYAPGYDVGYSAVPYYGYAPTYDVGAVGAGPYYAPGYDVAYTAGPYYDYAPGFSAGIGIGPVGIGIGPVGIGIGPAWGW